MDEAKLTDRITALEIAVATNSERIQAAKDHLEVLKTEREKQQHARYTADANALADLRAYTDRSFENLMATTTRRFGERDEALRIAFQGAKDTMAITLLASDKAVAKSEMAAEKRFEAVNEFRAQLQDQQQTFARKSETEIRFIAIEDKISTAVLTITQSKGKGEGLNAAWIYATGAIAAVIAIASVVLNFMK